MQNENQQMASAKSFMNSSQIMIPELYNEEEHD